MTELARSPQTRSALVRRLRVGAAIVALTCGALAAQSQSQAPSAKPSSGGASQPSSSQNQGSPFGAPEIDPSLATAAVAVVVGCALILLDRRRRARTS